MNIVILRFRNGDNYKLFPSTTCKDESIHSLVDILLLPIQTCDTGQDIKLLEINNQTIPNYDKFEDLLTKYLH